MTAFKYNADRQCAVTLHNGDSLSQKEFHYLYKQMPEGFRAELIGGVVFVREPLGLPHGDIHMLLGAIFTAFKASTAGTHTSNNATVILGKEDEVQPDLFMRIAPEYGGQSENTDKTLFVQGAPELILEIAHTSRSIDLHSKKQRYQLAGVIEYIVVCLEPAELHWFNLSKEDKLKADSDSIYRSEVFPGLWIDENALFSDNYHACMGVLNRGLASPEHAGFAEQLQSAHKDRR